MLDSNLVSKVTVSYFQVFQSPSRTLEQNLLKQQKLILDRDGKPLKEDLVTLKLRFGSDSSIQVVEFMEFVVPEDFVKGSWMGMENPGKRNL